MGTNFYFSSQNKELMKPLEYSYTCTDRPRWGYEIHVAKTSCGWLPLFQSYPGVIDSMDDYRRFLTHPDVIIYDEYGTEYTYEQFVERVLKFNGGVKGVAPPEPANNDPDSLFYDPDCPEEIPISHFEYGHGKYAPEYTTDKYGYEFTSREFC